MALVLISRRDNGEPEIFASIQGEGVSIGVPSVFVRFAECNLQCSFCDTKYTWQWDHYDRNKETIELSLSNVVDRIVQIANGARNVVITGGEPMLHQEAMIEIADALHGRGFRIEVETNGTIEPTAELAQRIDQWNVSPKLETSNNRLTARLRTGPLTWFAAAANANFKFVITAPSDLEEVLQIAKRFEIARERILLMPEGMTAADISERSAWLVSECQKHGMRFSTRLHVLLWGSERGR